MKSSFDAHFAYDHVSSWPTIINMCVIMDDAHYTIYEKVELTMTTSAKVQKPYLEIIISIHH
jgi:hypothetical protein